MAIVKTLPCTVYEGWPFGSISLRKIREPAMAEIRHLIPIETRAMQPARCTALSPGPMKIEGRRAMAPVTFRRPGFGSLGIRLAAAAALILQLGAIGAHAEELKEFHFHAA
jgi:hypothetical protein